MKKTRTTLNQGWKSMALNRCRIWLLNFATSRPRCSISLYTANRCEFKFSFYLHRAAGVASHSTTRTGVERKRQLITSKVLMILKNWKFENIGNEKLILHPGVNSWPSGALRGKGKTPRAFLSVTSFEWLLEKRFLFSTLFPCRKTFFSIKWSHLWTQYENFVMKISVEG